MPSHYGHNKLEPEFQPTKNTLKPRNKTVAKKQVTEGIDSEKAMQDSKVVRKAVTESIEKPLPVKRNRLREKL